MKKTLDELQAEFNEDAETLATLQAIYGEKAKQIRTNRDLPPDIHQRFAARFPRGRDLTKASGVSPGENMIEIINLVSNPDHAKLAAILNRNLAFDSALLGKVAEIIELVRQQGDEALCLLTQNFDG